jgi:hypothetical protein
MRTFADIIKGDPTPADVHSAQSLTATGRRRRRKPVKPLVLPAVYPRVAKSSEDAPFTLTVPIVKTDEALRTVYGWASVNSEGGALVTDHQGDQVTDAEMIAAAHDFMTSSRHGGLLHASREDGTPHSGGEIVESLVFTADVQKALGIDLGKTGLFVAYRVNDPDAWELVKSGTLRAFSIGGRAVRVPV